MSEYLHVEKPFLDQLATLGRSVIDQWGSWVSDMTIDLLGPVALFEAIASVH